MLNPGAAGRQLRLESSEATQRAGAWRRPRVRPESGNFSIGVDYTYINFEEKRMPAASASIDVDTTAMSAASCLDLISSAIFRGQLPDLHANVTARIHLQIRRSPPPRITEVVLQPTTQSSLHCRTLDDDWLLVPRRREPFSLTARPSWFHDFLPATSGTKRELQPRLDARASTRPRALQHQKDQKQNINRTFAGRHRATHAMFFLRSLSQTPPENAPRRSSKVTSRVASQVPRVAVLRNRPLNPLARPEQ